MYGFLLCVRLSDSVFPLDHGLTVVPCCYFKTILRQCAFGNGSAPVYGRIVITFHNSNGAAALCQYNDGMGVSNPDHITDFDLIKGCVGAARRPCTEDRIA